jgi:regulatory protein
LVADISLQECLDAAYRFLSYRPRSEGEIRQWLKRRGFDDEVAERVMARLAEQRLSDDLAFARFWKENRLSFRPRSRRLIQKELKEKKVPADIIEQVTEDIDDDQTAYKLACGRMQSLGGLDYAQFQRRLGSYLTYRGFSYEVVKGTVTRLWEERT